MIGCDVVTLPYVLETIDVSGGIINYLVWLVWQINIVGLLVCQGMSPQPILFVFFLFAMDFVHFFQKKRVLAHMIFM